MVIPIPPVPPATRKAIVKAIKAERPPHYKQQAQITLLQNKLKGQKERVSNAQSRLDRLEENKAEKLQEIKVIQEEEMEEALKKIKDDMEKEHEEALKVQEEEWKQNTEREMKAAKRQFKKEQAEIEEKELESYKQKVEEEKKKAQPEKLEKKKASSEDGEVEVGETEEDAEEDAEDDASPTEKLEKEHKNLKDKLETLTETKKEMGWLLKQVIQAGKPATTSQLMFFTVLVLHPYYTPLPCWLFALPPRNCFLTVFSTRFYRSKKAKGRQSRRRRTRQKETKIYSAIVRGERWRGGLFFLFVVNLEPLVLTLIR